MQPTDMVENRTFAEIRDGDSASLSTTIGRDEIATWSGLAGDPHALFFGGTGTGPAAAEPAAANGMQVAALIPSLLASRLPGPGTVYLGQDLRFLAPVLADDTITATVTVRQKRAEKRIVLFDCACVNQRGETVLSGTAEVVAPAEKRRAALAAAPPRRHEKYERLIARAKAGAAIATAVAHPCDDTSLRGAVEAAEAGIIAPILVGPEAKIRAAADAGGIDIRPFELVIAEHSNAAAAKAVELIRAGKAEILMKGSLHTDELLREVTAKETGLRTARRISHVFVMDVPGHPEVLFITDGAVNIAPDLEAKRDIVQNAIDFVVAISAGIAAGPPRVAILSAVETVTPKIPGTIEAAALCKMADRGQITGGILDGPLALDNAISPEAARIKGIKSEVAGHAQILVVPDLEAGNMLAKNLSFLANADAAGIVLGARVPIILTSRADSVRTRMASCAVATLYAQARRQSTSAATG
jgi:phosphotransacetylase/acyl dehydratase